MKFSHSRLNFIVGVFFIAFTFWSIPIAFAVEQAKNNAGGSRSTQANPEKTAPAPQKGPVALAVDTLRIEIQKINAQLSVLDKKLVEPTFSTKRTVERINESLNSQKNWLQFFILLVLVMCAGLAFLIYRLIVRPLGKDIATEAKTDGRSSNSSVPVVTDWSKAKSQLEQGLEEMLRGLMESWQASLNETTNKLQELFTRAEKSGLPAAQKNLDQTTTILAKAANDFVAQSQALVDVLEKAGYSLNDVRKNWAAESENLRETQAKLQNILAELQKRHQPVPETVSPAVSPANNVVRLVFDDEETNGSEAVPAPPIWDRLINLTRQAVLRQRLEALRQDVERVRRVADRHRETLALIAGEIYSERLDDEAAMQALSGLLEEFHLKIGTPRLGEIADVGMKRIPYRELREKRLKDFAQKNADKLTERKIDFKQSGTILGVVRPEIRLVENNKLVSPGQVVVY